MSKARQSEAAPAGGWRLASLFLLSASTLMFEVLLTKLFANKLEHHYTFAIIGLALLGYGGSGVLVQLRRATLLPGGRASTRTLWRYTCGWALLVLAALSIFIVLPLDPSGPGFLALIALPVYFLLFAIPFFVAGVPVAALLMSSDLHPSRVYFFDLCGAALGALVGPWMLSQLGAYAAVVLSAILGFAAAVMVKVTEDRRWGSIATASVGVAALSALSLVIPWQLRSRFGLDMVSFKAIVVKMDLVAFGAPVLTYWNAIARVDVSPTARGGNMSFCYGMPPATWSSTLPGRLILVDGGANTRQLAMDKHPRESPFLKIALWAAPYIARPGTRRSLIIGPGGGVDILVAKAFGVAEVDALELNPDIYKLLLGRDDDKERALYTPWLLSDAWTQVNVHNVEARHFANRHRADRKYGVVLASGVDTLTAIQSSGNALSENFLYTADAVRDYMNLLEPSGVLALTHWHLQPPRHALKMFATYLQVLEQEGVAEPGRHVVVISDAMNEKFAWESALLKKGEPFTRAEIEALRAYAKESDFLITWDALLAPDAPTHRPGDEWFRQIGRADHAERQRILDALPFDVTPATDDRPYFYWVNERSVGTTQYDGNWIYAEIRFPQASMQWMLRVALLLCLMMGVAPVIVLLRRKEGVREVMGALPFFALCGIAFVLTENAVFLMVTMFVGGPLHSLSLVLPSILGGYAIGSLLSARLAAQKRSSAALLAGVCTAGFAAMGAVAFLAFPSWITLGQAPRMLISVLAVVPFALMLGLFVPWYMARMRVRSSDPALAWMWSVSAMGNVLGSLLFVPFCHAVGTRALFACAALLYLLALAWALFFERLGPRAVEPHA